jgi:hypothetical protein
MCIISKKSKVIAQSINFQAYSAKVCNFNIFSERGPLDYEFETTERLGNVNYSNEYKNIRNDKRVNLLKFHSII